MSQGTPCAFIAGSVGSRSRAASVLTSANAPASIIVANLFSMRRTSSLRSHVMKTFVARPASSSGRRPSRCQSDNGRPVASTTSRAREIREPRRVVQQRRNQNDCRVARRTIVRRPRRHIDQHVDSRGDDQRRFRESHRSRLHLKQREACRDAKPSCQQSRQQHESQSRASHRQFIDQPRHRRRETQRLPDEEQDCEHFG